MADQEPAAVVIPVRGQTRAIPGSHPAAGPGRRGALRRTSVGRGLEQRLAKVRDCREALSDLEDAWRSARERPLWWDPYYGVFRTRRSQGTMNGLFGYLPDARSLMNPRKRVSRPRNAWRIVSRYPLIGPTHLGVALPSDAVVLPAEPSKNGAAVASRKGGLLLKVTYDVEGVRKEVESWDIARSAGIQEHLPRLVDHGATADGGFWAMSQFVPNSEPVDHPLNPFASPRRDWFRWLRWKILPTMERFYEASGLEIVEPGIRIENVRDALLRDGMPDSLFGVLGLAEAALESGASGEVITAILHKDLIPRHLHRHRTRWWILDWGATGRGIICKDYFREFFWRMVPRDPKHRAFWAWLRGDLPSGSLPRDLTSQVRSYLDWHSSWRRTSLDPESLRLRLLLALLDDYRDVIQQFDLKDRLAETEHADAFPRLARTLMPQLRALGVA